MRRTSFASFLIALAFPLLVGLASPRGASAWPNDPTSGVPLTTAQGAQASAASTQDGAGGLIVAWADQRGADQDIYAMRLTKSGDPYPGWIANGVPVCVIAGFQQSPVLTTDGAGGAIIAWQDPRSGNNDIYAQHITGAGTIAPGWPVNGLVVGAAAPAGLARDELTPQIASDGSGGAYVVWTLVYIASTDLDIYGNHVTGAGTIVSGWSVTGSAIDADGSIQDNPSICPDGTGGVIVAYQDNFNGNYDIHAKRVGPNEAILADQYVNATSGDQAGPVARSDDAGGAFLSYTSTTNYLYLSHVRGDLLPAPGWGGAISVNYNAAGYDYASDIAGDGSGGAYVSWGQSNGAWLVVYLHHILADGSMAAGWPTAGTYLPSSYAFSSNQTGRLVGDGAAGVIAVYPSNASHIYALRLEPAGSVANGWPSGGAPVCTATGGQYYPIVVPDGGGGGLVAWMDYRNGNYDLYANRIEHFGKLGNPEPVIASVKDVLNDQGGQLRVSWRPSYLDVDPTYGIYEYYLFRQVPGATALATVRRGAAHTMSAEEFADTTVSPTLSGPRYLVTQDAAQTLYWEQVASIPATELPGYSLVAATTGDSVAGSNPYTLFMVDAIGSGGGYWFSTPDSGYSVDNLPPAMPVPFSGTYVQGQGAFLTWGPNPESDLAGYRLYRGDSPGFIPGPSNLVSAQTLVGFTDAGAPPSVYKLSAVDVHGNESPFAYLLPAGTADAPLAQVPREVFLSRAEPNPARGAATLRFGLPRDGVADLALFDSQGRRVRALMQGAQPAGEYAVRWDGRDDGGHAVASGIYFVRLSVEGRTLTQRLVDVH